MHPFTYTKATDTQEALKAARRGGRYIAGGTTLVDLMRETVEHPETLVDISALPLSKVTATKSGGLHIGALVRMSEAAAHPKVRALYPVISQALELSASAQLRNMATIGGNIMQRTRCAYFRDVTADCNKRDPGSGCAALQGYNRSHAILGTSDRCVATHPSDLAVALAALEATVHLLGPDGERTVPLADFLLKPGRTPNREQALRKGELITAVEVPAHPRPLKSGYLKVRDRQSYEFALTSAAIALHIRGGVIREAKVAAGGVGTVPWKLPAVERHLIGERPSDRLWAEAAGHAADGASPLRVTDHRDGRIVNANLADYLVPTHADMPDMKAIYIEGEDFEADPIGVKGLGEIVLVGVAPAIANAVFNATGRRIRELPITPEALL